MTFQFKLLIYDCRIDEPDTDGDFLKVTQPFSS